MKRNLGLSHARREFAILLDSHLKRGQNSVRPSNQWRPWSNNDFAGVVGVSPNSVANWRNGQNPIPPEDIIPVLNALFGDEVTFAPHRRAVREAWERAKGLVPDPVPEPEDAWEAIERTGGIFAEVTLHPPVAANQPEHFRLSATVHLAPAEHDADGRIVIIGLKEAFLSITTSGHQIAFNSLIGERTPHSNVSPGVGGVFITGPRDSDGLLKGNPIGDDHLAAIEPGVPGNDTVTLRVCATPRSFSFAYASDPDSLIAKVEERPNRTAILSVLLGEMLSRDSLGRIILASASMRRKNHET